jgi:hypothetical protein
MSANQTPLAIPAAAAKFIEDAKAVGYDVEVKQHTTDVEVWVEMDRGTDYVRNASLIWNVTNTAGNNPRLGFATSYKRGVRFGYANARIGYKYPVVKSVAQVRRVLGIPAN